MLVTRSIKSIELNSKRVFFLEYHVTNALVDNTRAGLGGGVGGGGGEWLGGGWGWCGWGWGAGGGVGGVWPYQHALTLIRIWMNNHIHHKVGIKIFSSIIKRQRCNVEVKKRINNFIPHSARHVITYPFRNYKPCYQMGPRHFVTPKCLISVREATAACTDVFQSSDFTHCGLVAP